MGEGVGMPVGLSELYKLGKAIGEGAFGFVRVAQQRQAGGAARGARHGYQLRRPEGQA